MGGKRFSDKEMAKIIRKASEIQNGGGSSLDGVSESELRAVAAELGIDPENLNSAIREVESNIGSKNFWGGPYEVDIARTIPGVLTDESWEDVVTDLRKVFEETGEIAQRGTTREWSSKSAGTEFLTATFRQSDDSVESKVTNKFNDIAFLIHLVLLVFPLFITIGVLSKVNLAFPIEAGIAVATMLAGFFGSRKWATHYGSRRKASINQLLDRLEANLSRSSRENSLPAESYQQDLQDAELNLNGE